MSKNELKTKIQMDLDLPRLKNQGTGKKRSLKIQDPIFFEVDLIDPRSDLDMDLGYGSCTEKNIAVIITHGPPFARCSPVIRETHGDSS